MVDPASEGIAVMKFGMIGAGTISQAIAGHVVKAGHEVVFSNSRGPQSLASVAEAAGPVGTPTARGHPTATAPVPGRDPMNGLLLAAGGGAGAGAALVVRGMVPPRPPLAQTIAGLRRRRVGAGGPDPQSLASPLSPSPADHPDAPATGWAARAGRPAAAG